MNECLVEKLIKKYYQRDYVRISTQKCKDYAYHNSFSTLGYDSAFELYKMIEKNCKLKIFKTDLQKIIDLLSSAQKAIFNYKYKKSINKQELLELGWNYRSMKYFREQQWLKSFLSLQLLIFGYDDEKIQDLISIMGGL